MSSWHIEDPEGRLWGITYVNKRWNNAENPEGRVWALIYTEMYDYQVAQWDPQLNEWSFYYKHVLSSVRPQYTPVWWSRLPRPPLKEQDSRLIDKIFALEPDDDA